MEFDASLQIELREGANLEEVADHAHKTAGKVGGYTLAMNEMHEESIADKRRASKEAIEACTTPQHINEITRMISALEKSLARIADQKDSISFDMQRRLVLLEVMVRAYGTRIKFEDLGVLNNEPTRTFLDTLVLAEDGNSVIGSIACQVWMHSYPRIARRVCNSKDGGFDDVCKEAGKRLNEIMGTEFHGLLPDGGDQEERY